MSGLQQRRVRGRPRLGAALVDREADTVAEAVHRSLHDRLVGAHGRVPGARTRRTPVPGSHGASPPRMRDTLRRDASGTARTPASALQGAGPRQNVRVMSVVVSAPALGGEDALIQIRYAREHGVAINYPRLWGTPASRPWATMLSRPRRDRTHANVVCSSRRRWPSVAFSPPRVTKPSPLRRRAQLGPDALHRLDRAAPSSGGSSPARPRSWSLLATLSTSGCAGSTVRCGARFTRSSSIV